MDMELILGLGKFISLVSCMVFIEGLAASRPTKKATYYGLILPIIMTAVTIGTHMVWREWIYTVLVLVPSILCWTIYYFCRRSIRNGTALSLQEDEFFED